MSIALDPAWLLAVFFVAVRLSAVLLLSPILSSLSGLVTVRILLVLALSVLLVDGLEVRPAMQDNGLGPVFVGALLELATGVTLAFGVFAAFGAFSMAGKILDIQSGFGMGTVYDPVTRGGAPLFGTMLNMLGVMVFFGLDGHHAFLRGLAYSLQQVPPGSGLPGLAPEIVIRQFGLMFSLGVALVIPVILCLLLTETALAVVSRVLPQMNVFVVGIPVKTVAALGLLAMTLGVMGAPMGKVYAAIFNYWEQVLG